MERTAAAARTAPPTPPPDAPEPPGNRTADLLDGMPRQRGPAPSGPPAAVPAPARTLPAPRPWRLLPTPTGTPFTFAYAALLAVTSLLASFADPSLVRALQQGSSTDVAHLAGAPGAVLVASALWIAGGAVSPYVLGFLLVLTALERRVGALHAAAVFLLGHVLATVATEVPVGLAVLAGQLPVTSLHRLDYGISFGVAAVTGALAGLVARRLRWTLLALFGAMVAGDLIEFADPMTDWGHLIALAVGIATWPLVRRRHRSSTSAVVRSG
ncbi:rhomboid-like protein [Streptomyces shenzhenensis]|uniref:rhomboid-like protein n=1 Tax=Streptomyces shenzhenensis TaxID=943815 RepID=UPI003D9063EE